MNAVTLARVDRAWEDLAGEDLRRLRAERPLVHHITNVVTVNDCANAVLSLGALPVMAHAPEEVAEMVGSAGSLVLNLGTPDPQRIAAMVTAGRRANQLGIPVVFDPVGCGATAVRQAWAQRVLQEVRVTVVRGNFAEVCALAGLASRLRGVESAEDDPAQHAPALAARLARTLNGTVAITGKVDYVSDGRRELACANGHPLLQRVSGTGCMATSVVAAFCAVQPDPVRATAEALALYGLAAERAAAATGQAPLGPGTFKVRLFDALYLFDEEALTGLRIRALEGGTAAQS